MQQELKDYNPAQSSNLTAYKVETAKIKQLVFKIYSDIEGDWDTMMPQLEQYVSYYEVKQILDKIYGSGNNNDAADGAE